MNNKLTVKYLLQEIRFEQRNQSIRLAPPVAETAKALASIVHSMRWKTVAIIHIGQLLLYLTSTSPQFHLITQTEKRDGKNWWQRS